MSDLLALAVLFACALSCSLAVVLFDTFVLPAIKAFYRALTEQLHRHRADSDGAIVGDVVRLPDDLKVTNFHATQNTRGRE